MRIYINVKCDEQIIAPFVTWDNVSAGIRLHCICVTGQHIRLDRSLSLCVFRDQGVKKWSIKRNRSNKNTKKIIDVLSAFFQLCPDANVSARHCKYVSYDKSGSCITSQQTKSKMIKLILKRSYFFKALHLWWLSCRNTC